MITAEKVMFVSELNVLNGTINVPHKGVGSDFGQRIEINVLMRLKKVNKVKINRVTDVNGQCLVWGVSFRV